MEDYQKAHELRLQDIDCLLAGPNKRMIAAAHLGGVAVECRLKALIAVYHQIAEWDQPSRRPRDPKRGTPIPRTGHSLIAGVRLMPDIYAKAKADPLFLGHLSNLNFPLGSTVNDFIALRYSSTEPDEELMTSWKESLNYVLGWLKKNEALL